MYTGGKGKDLMYLHMSRASIYFGVNISLMKICCGKLNLMFHNCNYTLCLKLFLLSQITNQLFILST